jgi:hypothetical protein
MVDWVTTLLGRMNLGSVILGQEAASILALPVAPGDPTRFFRLMMTPAN